MNIAHYKLCSYFGSMYEISSSMKTYFGSMYESSSYYDRLIGTLSYMRYSYHADFMIPRAGSYLRRFKSLRPVILR